MFNTLSVLSENMITTIISTVAIIVGALVGGVCSWVITKKQMIRSEKVQSKMVEENRKYEEKHRIRRVCRNAALIRLDICNAIFQSIRSLKTFNCDEGVTAFPVPLNSNYSLVVSSLEGKFDLKEMSYIYQLYGIIEKTNCDIKNLNCASHENHVIIKLDYELLLKKIYGEKYLKILEYEMDKISYEQLYENDYIKEGYKHVLKKLDEVCDSCIRGMDCYEGESIH
jgi:hypothetical protein